MERKRKREELDGSWEVPWQSRPIADRIYTGKGNVNKYKDSY